MFQVPSYNRSIKHDIDVFANHSMQDIMALFVAKKQEEITRQLKSVPHFQREDLFFGKFFRFAEPYINYGTLPIDTVIYFRSASEQTAGTQNGAGGTGNKSNSYAKSFQKANKANAQYNQAMTAYFEEKYGATIRGEKDQRRFLDEPRLWNKLATDDYILPEKWRNEANRGYDDATFVCSMPKMLNKQLVPLKIRNKVVQKHKHCGHAPITKIGSEEETEDETGPESGDEDETIKLNTKKIEIDADMQKILDEEGW
jgi:hypothetical protein